MSLTADPTDPRLGKWDGKPEDKPTPQHEVYLVLSDEERAKGFVRPYRDAYKHVGIAGPTFPLRDLTDEEKQTWGDKYAKYEPYPAGHKGSALGHLWSQAKLDSIGKGCGTVTTMGRALSETYARDPHFYGATYCCGCMKHFAVGDAGEFVWTEDGARVGT